ncbi:energy transducer TonB family protein [Novosphingobium gossypii]|uniref:energy transducer TonB family protein n=1 Tax=Novosphingobium gossypii TaxID=1604774 RepID=UPI003D1F8EF9
MVFPWGSRDFGHPMAQVDLKAMIASIAAHAAVFAALAMTWEEATLIEGGTRAALVSIDLASREGGPGPNNAPATEPQAIQQQPVAQPVGATITEPQARSSSLSETTPPAAKSGGGGEGRSGQGTAAATIDAQPLPRLVPVRAMLVPVAAPGPQSRVEDSAAGEQGAGGRGGGRTDQAGNAAIGNFKGRIYQHLLRHRHSNTIGSGEVLVAFTIEPDGTARAISVARGSGSSRFDREALALVRRASPFPRPPDGVAHSFTFAITGQ